MKIALAGHAPVFELDGELDRRLGLADELALIETEGGIDLLDGRNRGLANTDNANVVRFNQLDIDLAAKNAAQHGRCHPAGSATADYDYLANSIVHSC